MAKMTPEKEAAIRQMAAEGFSQAEIARVSGFHRNTICALLNGLTHRRGKKTEDARKRFEQAEAAASVNASLARLHEKLQEGKK